MSDLVKRLNHSITMAINDDMSQPLSAERQRHCERIDAMQEAAARIAELEAALAEARQLIADLSDDLQDEGNIYSTDGLDMMRRRVANALLPSLCPDWLKQFGDHATLKEKILSDSEDDPQAGEPLEGREPTTADWQKVVAGQRAIIAGLVAERDEAQQQHATCIVALTAERQATDAQLPTAEDVKGILGQVEMSPERRVIEAARALLRHMMDVGAPTLRARIVGELVGALAALDGGRS